MTKRFFRTCTPLFAAMMIASALALVPFAVTLSGCASTGGKPSPIVAQIAVSYATMKVVERNPAYGPRIVAIAQSVKAAASGDASATVLGIDALIRAQIRWEKLLPSDRMVVEILLGAIRDELTARIGGGVLDPDKLLIVAQVAGWIESAAAAAQGPTIAGTER